MIEGAPAPAVPDVTLSDAAALARTYIDAGDRPADAAKKAAGQTGHKKNEIYKQIVE